MFGKISFLTGTLFLILVALIGGVVIYFVYDASLNEITRINQIYAKTKETIAVDIYFCHSGPGEAQSCECDSPVSRRITSSPNMKIVATAAINKFLEGPTVKEKEEGYSSGIPTKEQIASYKSATGKEIGDEIKLLGLTIENSMATANFSEELLAYGGSSCRAESISSSIANTLLQFSSIKGVKFLVNNNPTSLQP